jgi:outer membrane autotransporter protein
MESLWLDSPKIPDAFDENLVPHNLHNAENGMSHWLNFTPPGLALNPYQVLQLRRDFQSGPPEAIMDMALVGMDVHDMVRSAAGRGFNNRGDSDRVRDSMPADCMPVECAPVECPPVECPSGRFRVWAGYVGGIDKARETSRFAGYDTHTNGGLAGIAWDASPAFSVGAYFGYSRSTVDFNGISADGDSDGIHTGIQASVRTPFGLRVTADGSYSHQSVDVSRYPGHFAPNVSSFSQKLYGAGLEIAWPFTVLECTRVTPAASLDAVWMRQNEVRESGPIMASIVDKVSAHSLLSRLGATVEHDFSIGNGVISPGLGVNWKHRFSGGQLDSRYSFIDNINSGFYDKDAIRSRDRGRDSLELSAFIDASLWAGRSNWSLRGGYTLDVGKKRTAHVFYAGVGVSF